MTLPSRADTISANKGFIRIGLRTKLVILSSFLFTIPWFGYQYVWEMEKYLRYGQEQTIVGTARALATTLHDRPNLFDNQASFLASVEKGKDLYGFQIRQPIQLDGRYNDWPDFEGKAHFYQDSNIIWQEPNQAVSLRFNAAVGKYDKYLYLFFNVVDDKLVFRGNNARSIYLNDHLTLSLTAPDGEHQQYIVSNKNQGWIESFQLDNQTGRPQPINYIQGVWQSNNTGYNVELRLPLDYVGNKIGFSFADVDTPSTKATSLVGSANTSDPEQLGTILVPSPEIERIVKGMSYTQSSIWVIDKHQRVLASAGDINSASGVWRSTTSTDASEGIWPTWWHWLQTHVLHPLYYQVLTKPTQDFYDQLYDESHLAGEHIEQALSGEVHSQWRLSTDKQAVILSAAYPIYIDEQVQGAVIVEETTNGIKTLRNKALEQLFTSILAILLVGTISFFFFASRISNRIRQLRNHAEVAIDEHGRVKEDLPALKGNDEIGDLSRSFSTAVSRLTQYNQYLENLSSRLSHELRTPIAVVRTSIENLSMYPIPENAKAYIERAESGVHRLNHIITSMTEATRVEQLLQRTEKQTFNAYEVIASCISGFKQIHPETRFNFQAPNQKANVLGSPEHLAQMLEKIVTNAVEFSSDSQVGIMLITVKKNLILTVKNNGELLPDTMENRLFNSMVSLREESNSLIKNNQQTPATSQPSSNSQPHLGLGLFIARLICEYHQGQISAQNCFDPNGVQINIEIPLTE
ncbi:proteobacterial dedicated sortase system histidine kinase [Thalassotalea euphylliae]|uniref:histidine kinase n=1 Tax=Thalassotalea euphylliae TaxID=1655234 RepID=A0A3E0TQI5_9GAMM|nr:proteobacterial dedicated sortase system histidine kinase [Thalassotalea euphylliae]REL26799.1 proteobacterial dedicated sortase system histidine kinase [Thalassotalea euphylliae]